jgi:hypothetical protein
MIEIEDIPEKLFVFQKKRFSEAAEQFYISQQHIISTITSQYISTPRQLLLAKNNEDYNEQHVDINIIYLIIIHAGESLCIRDIVNILSTSRYIRYHVPVYFREIHTHSFSVFYALLTNRSNSELYKNIITKITSLTLHSPVDDKLIDMDKDVVIPPELKKITLNIYTPSFVTSIQTMKFIGLQIHINMKDHWSAYTFTQRGDPDKYAFSINHTSDGKVLAHSYFTKEEYERYIKIENLDYKSPAHTPVYHNCVCGFNDITDSINDDFLTQNSVSISHNNYSFRILR